MRSFHKYGFIHWTLATYYSGLTIPNGNATVQFAKLYIVIFPPTNFFHFIEIFGVDEMEEDVERFYSDIFREVEKEAAKFDRISKFTSSNLDTSAGRHKCGECFH